jgi:ATP-dependent 26S proteasome regulatory subunit
MSPDYFVIPIIMGQASSIIESLKTGIIFFDMALLGFLILLFYNTDKEYLQALYRHCREHNKKSIVISTEVQSRSVKFKAIMFFLTQQNESIYRLKEDRDYTWDDDDREKQHSTYLVEQLKEFKLTEEIQGRMVNDTREKHRHAQFTEIVEVNTLTIYTYSLSLAALQAWVEAKVVEYKEHLRHTSNEKQLFITARTAKPNEVSNKKKKSGNSNRTICLESVPWESSITFQNSYFHEMETVLKKIDFFLQNKAWYLEKGIPYNLGILLYGEPGCGKTRFIKQLMNYTKRHGIDIKLNDGMDFNDLQYLIYNEELDETHIIPQSQRILIFEDIDALGEIVKERSATVIPTPPLPPVAPAPAPTPTCDTSNNGVLHNNNNIVTNDLLSSLLKINNANKNNNLSYLLNMLDGIHECSGRILIMTTNRLEVLDKALIRPGRIDIKLHFKKCSSYDVAKMIEKFWLIEVPLEELLPDIDDKYTSADIINIFRSTDDFLSIRSQFIQSQFI